MSTKPSQTAAPKALSIFTVLTPYLRSITLLAVLTIAANGLSLWVPKIISKAIDAYARHTLDLTGVGWELGLIGFVIFLLTYGQNILQAIVSEQVARDLRHKLAAKISEQTLTFVQQTTPDRLLTNLTSDIDAVKTFVAQAVASLISSIALIVGASILLLSLNWRLGLVVLTIIPLIGGFFFWSLGRVRALFLQGRAIIDHLNGVINESIHGAALIRVLFSQQLENQRFDQPNAQSRNIGLKIITVFAGLIPTITFIANLSSLAILGLGGYYVIHQQMTIGDFAAFSTYISILIFPIIILGFISNMIAQASASYSRIIGILNTPATTKTGNLQAKLDGSIQVQDLTLKLGQKNVLKHISLTAKPGSRTAIIGPTAAGKTLLLYTMVGLLPPTQGTITYDHHLLAEFQPESLHQQIGMVFQDSVVFNLSLRENIAFSSQVIDADLHKALATAELTDLVATLPQGLDTLVSERGTSLSGGQKQRLMLARALALSPKILLLDDFTARVDAVTEQKILANLQQNYPGLTLISVTQKIGPIEHYDQILLLMEGELLATGTHQELLQHSPEYAQIYTTQQSTNT